MSAHPDHGERLTLEDGHQVRLSKPDKVLFPQARLTKKDLVRHYRRMAKIMLPHLRGRPLSLQRFPDGLAGSGFYQKAVPGYFPEWIERAELRVKEDGRRQSQVVANNAATLVYLANQACITPHPWLSRADRPHQPDRVLFDLDPPKESEGYSKGQKGKGAKGDPELPGAGFDRVRRAALDLHDVLQKKGLTPFVMTTGSRGLHVMVPLRRGPGFDEVRDFARDLAEELAGKRPAHYSTAPRIADRKGRLYLDTLRNAYGQTGVAPYAARARPGAPVATPLDWSELRQSRVHPRRYGLRNIGRRLGQKADPWRDIDAHAAKLPA
jgi:bifunctional non-homologous end joining protein LigD